MVVLREMTKWTVKKLVKDVKSDFRQHLGWLESLSSKKISETVQDHRSGFEP